MRRGFTIHHNGPNANCLGKPHSRCEGFWAGVKAFHQQKWPDSNDIAYSFGVCPHGIRLEGRGWDKNQFANGTDLVGANDGADSEWYTVLTFIGWDPDTGVEEQPTPSMIAATAALIEEGRGSGRCSTRVTPHNFWKDKRCPGLVFTARARQWDNQPISIPDPVKAEEPDMLIIDSPEKPALVIGVGGVKRISAEQRSALREIGVERKQVDPDTSDALFSLKDA